jgi:dephospho-CoA kinase
MNAILRVGLTGGVGSGKSQVAHRLRQAKVTVIDMDVVGRDLTEKDPGVLAKIQKICGKEAVKDGHLNRTYVREIIFGDLKARKSLEALIHPLVWESFEKSCHEAAARKEKLIVCEAALIVETGYHEHLDRLIVVTAPEELRRDRVVLRDRLPPNLAQQMIESQTREAERLGAATTILYNDGVIEKLEKQVDSVITEWKTEGFLI